MHPQVGKFIYDLADQWGREMTAQEIGDAFHQHFANVTTPLELVEYELLHLTEERGVVECRTTILYHQQKQQLVGRGNGPINAFVHALESAGLKDFKVTDYRSHAVRGGSDASAAAYVQVQADDGRLLWGAGIDGSIEMAGLRALVSAWNLLHGNK